MEVVFMRHNTRQKGALRLSLEGDLRLVALAKEPRKALEPSEKLAKQCKALEQAATALYAKFER